MNTVHVSRRALVLTLTAAALVLAGIVTAVLILTGGNADSATSPGAPTSQVAKTFTIVGKLEVSSGCGRGGYSDIREGAQVELINQKGEVLAVTTLKEGFGHCEFDFTLSSVPKGHNLYGVTLGNNNRGTIWKTEQEASTSGFSLTLG